MISGLSVSLVALAASAQVASEPYSVRCFGVADGLPHASVHSVVQHRSGKLIVATYAGLVAFDGGQFTRQAPGLDVDFPVVESSTMAVEPGGAVWIGTTVEGIIRVGPEGLTRWGPREGLPDPAVAGMQYLDDRLWFAGSGGSMFTITAGDARVGPGTPRPDSRLQVPFGDGRGHFWLASLEGLYERTPDGATWRRVSLPGLGPDFDDLSAGAFAGGRVVVARRGEIYALAADGTPTRLASVGPANVSALLGEGDALWIATEGRGVYRLGKAGLERIHELGESDVRALGSDREGNVWVAGSAGLCRVRPSPFRELGAQEGLATSDVTVVHAAPGGEVYVATRSGDVAVVREQRAVHVASADPAVVGDVRDLQIDGSGQVWVCGARGLFRLIVDHFEAVPGTWGACSLQVDAEGTLLVGAAGALSRVDADGRVMDSLPVPGGGRVSYVVRGASGAIYLLTRDGLLRQAGGVLTRIEGPGSYVTSVLEDGERLLVTGDGLWVVDATSTRQLGSADGLPLGHLHAIVQDHAGDYWLSSNAGLYRARRDRLLAYLSLADAPAPFERFDERSGLGSSEFNGSGSCATVDAAGRVWFAGVAGAVAVSPELVEQPALALEPGFGRVYADGVAVPHRDLASLTQDLARLRVEYTAVHLADLGRVEFRHRLIGYDASWQVTDDRHVEFRKLPPGHYRFDLQARLGGAAWSPTAALAFVVVPEWWQRGWARAGGLALVLGLVVGVPLWRARGDRATRRRLEKIVDERTAELRRLNARLDAAARTDALTGVANRRDFDEQLAAALRSAEATDTDLAVCLVDIDHFKAFNDQFGHPAGDECIRQVASVLASSVRPGDHVARIGGEEFALILPGQSVVGARVVAERLRQGVRALGVRHAHGLPFEVVTVSIGVADDEAGGQAMVARADRALYQAKRSGRDRTCTNPELG